MAPKKKRKSTASTDEQPPKRPGSQQGRRSTGGGGSGSGGSGSPALTWTADGVTVTLPFNQALVFLGKAVLEVQSGEVAALGAILTPNSGAVELAADERCGGPLLLEPGQPEGAVPLVAADSAVLRLSPIPGSSSDISGGPPTTLLAAGEAAAGAACGSAGGHQQLGFEAWLSSDPSAPPVPPPLPQLWRQAAGEVQHTIAALEAHGAVGAGQPPVIVVCGAKKVGKSTFARVLLNSMLARHGCVAYLDTDCGQPEFTAPGLVSLTLVTSPVLGPPHMHPRRPAVAFFVGDVSPANDPARYLQYVRELYRWYCRHGATAAAAAVGSGMQQQQQQQLPLPPLVVNTHGWVKGMGYDVLVELLQELPVSHMIQIAASNPKKNLPPGCFWLVPPEAPHQGQQQQQQQQQQQGREPLQWLLPGLGGDQQAQPAASETSARSFVTLGGAVSDAGGGGGGGGKGRLNATEQRALQWESLARQCIANCCMGQQAAGSASRNRAASGTGAAAGDLGDLLAAAVPFEVGADDVDVQVLHSSVPASQLFFALNGAVVGLCTTGCEPQHSTAAGGAAGGPAAAGTAVAASDNGGLPLPRCLCLGIVRAADGRRRWLHVLTPLTEAELESVDVLQLGRLELPASLLQTAAHMCPYLALFSLSSTGTGAGAIKSRGNLLRISQL